MSGGFYFCSSPKFTVRVDVDDRGVVTGGAPVIRRFVGQPFENLKRWAKFDRIEKLAPPEAESGEMKCEPGVTG